MGMERAFGEDGIEIYQLPTGSRIRTEEFSEFGDAFQLFKETREFTHETQRRIEHSQLPLLCVEGETDCDYLRKASELLNMGDLLERFELFAAGNDSMLNKIESNSKTTPESAAEKVILLHDPESRKCPEKSDGTVYYRRKMPKHDEHPLSKGIENLFDLTTIEKVCCSNLKIIDVREAVKTRTRDVEAEGPKTYTVNSDEKRNLCNWLCENGTKEDFCHFRGVFDILNDIVEKIEAA